MVSQTRELPEIGPVEFVKNPRAKRLNIRLQPFQGVRVAFPAAISWTQAEQLVLTRLPWIKRHLAKLRQVEQQQTRFDEQTQFRTRHHQLRVVRSATSKLSVRAVNGLIKVDCPDTVDILNEEVQQAIRVGIERAWRKEAKAYLPGRLDHFSGQHRLPYQDLRVKNTKSRWGSCTASNRINLSLHLMRLPDHLIDYVILHELAHTIEKNHGTGFWTLLQRISGNARGLDRELKQHSPRIY